MMTQTRVTVYHDISTGHRVYGHESKCSNLHGHNYRVHFTCESPSLDNLGRVIDFSAIKQTLCQYLEVNWDHKFLIFSGDPLRDKMLSLPGLVVTTFNPTAENMANFLLIVGRELLCNCTNTVELVSVRVEETVKCSAETFLVRD